MEDIDCLHGLKKNSLRCSESFAGACPFRFEDFLMFVQVPRHRQVEVEIINDENRRCKTGLNIYQPCAGFHVFQCQARKDKSNSEI